MNGSLLGTDNPSGVHAVPNADNLTVGLTASGEYFNGKIQNVNIYNVCLSETEVQQNYEALLPIIEPPTSGADFTIQWFMNMNSQGAHPRVFSFGTYPAYNGVSIEGGTLYWWINNGVGLSADLTSYLGAWHHVALVRHSGNITIYFDGVSLATSTLTSAIPTGGNNLFIGDEGTGTTGGDSYFDGLLSNFSFTNGVALYTSDFTPPTAPLTADVPYTKLLNLQSTTNLAALLIDNSGNANNATAYNSPTTSVSNPFGDSTISLLLDGTTQYLVIPANTEFDIS